MCHTPLMVWLIPSGIRLAAAQGGSPLQPPQPVTGLAICSVSIVVLPSLA